MLIITSLYAGVSGLVFLLFSVLVIRCRLKYSQVIGDGGHDIMIRHIRAHANFIEYVPLTLILMAVLEVSKTSIYILHFIGIILIIGRILHFYSLTSHEPKTKAKGDMVIIYRQIGMILTFLALFCLSVLAIVKFLGV